MDREPAGAAAHHRHARLVQQVSRRKPTDRIDADDAYNTVSKLWLNAVFSIYRELGGYTESQGLQGTARACMT